MLSRLHFETASRAAAPAAARADVACFIGYVGRRPRQPLPAAVRAQLRSAGWVDGPWRRTAGELDSLLHLPVTVDSWDAFDALYAWDRRPLVEGRPETCASYLGAAVRSYFASGGRRAVIVRVGDPWACRGGASRKSRRLVRLRALVPGVSQTQRPFALMAPDGWRGLEHLYGLAEVSHLCLPDLADACAAEPPLPSLVHPLTPPEGFTDCSEGDDGDRIDLGLRGLAMPQLDNGGFVAWRDTVATVREFLARHRRDALFIGHLPAARADTRLDGAWAQARPLDYLAALDRDDRLSSAFVQLVWPWLATARADDLPAALEAPDGVFAGLLAANALSRGTFRSVAGRPLDEVRGLEPVPDLGPGRDHPGARLAERVCLIGEEAGSIAVLSDVTTSRDPGWRQGGSSRLMAALLRSAREIGHAEVFETSGPEQWSRLRRSFETLLDGWWRAGGLGGNRAEEAYSVRCDRTLMSQNDLDNGRLRVEVTVRPAVAVERITVLLDLEGGSAALRLREVA